MQDINEDLEKIIITFQSLYANASSIIDEEAWPELLIEFSKVLNKAGYFVPVDLVEKYTYNGILKEYQHRLEARKLGEQLELDLE